MSSKFFGVLLVCAAATTVFAYDSDPGYGPRPSTAVPRTTSTKTQAAAAFRPTMRYYGAGYTVAYRYVPWTEKMPRLMSTSFESDQLHLQAVAKGGPAEKQAPRVTYYYKTNAAPVTTRTPVTPPTATKEMPAIAERTGR
jgi:hypothetical protein